MVYCDSLWYIIVDYNRVQVQIKHLAYYCNSRGFMMVAAAFTAAKCHSYDCDDG